MTNLATLHGYQRGRIQDESMHGEMLKHTDELPIIDANFFRNPHDDAVLVCSLGQITTALFEVGGQYRRNM